VTAMSDTETRPYHHGDLRRALIGAARQLLESVGADSLSLRAVAREAGVSPAAPYHHFKDKNELLIAVAELGFAEMLSDLRLALNSAAAGEEMIAVGLAYVNFARTRRALYQVMGAAARSGQHMPDESDEAVARLISEASVAHATNGSVDDQAVGLATWATLHGLSELIGFKVLDPVKEQFGGEMPFLRHVLSKVGAFSRR
jgi:AcrR family transcriptional regulator